MTCGLAGPSRATVQSSPLTDAETLGAQDEVK
jgi:hypothetical protein